MRERGRHRSAIRLAALGLALSPGAPIGLWLLTRWLRPESEIGFALVYSGVATALVFTLFGGWAGLVMDRLRKAAMHDGLTGLFNRRFLREALPSLQAAAVRRKEPLCLLMLDLDHFKRVNDRHGHLVGDQTLRAVAEVLRGQSRRSDLVARHGGEEFAVLCPATDGPTGVQVAERLREAIAGLDAEALGHPDRRPCRSGSPCSPTRTSRPNNSWTGPTSRSTGPRTTAAIGPRSGASSIAQSFDASSSTSRA